MKEAVSSNPKTENDATIGARFHVAFVAVSSPLHYTLWNALAAESLAGDLQGHFRGRVATRIYRVRSGSELETISHHLLAASPDLIGISTECGGLDLSLDFASRLKPWIANHPQRFIFGGKLPSQVPDTFLARFPDALVVIGEGEVPLREIVKLWLDNPHGRPQFDHIANIAYVDQVKPRRRTKPECSTLKYPPALDTVGEILDAGGGTVLVQASRGCSWAKCDYCAVTPFRRGKKWEPLLWSRTLKHLESLTWLGAREFEFCDDDFFGGRKQKNLKRIKKIASSLQDLWPKAEFPEGIRFRIFLPPGTVYKSRDPEGNKHVRDLLQQLKQAGLARVYLGIESGSAVQLKRYRRGTTLTDALNALRVLRELELGVDCGFLMFDPEASVDDIELNLNFFKQNKLLEHNQWPFRAVDAYDGAKLATRLTLTSRSRLDPAYLSYRYCYRDPSVGRIANTVDHLAGGSAPLFYALKTLSKAHFGPSSTESPASRAFDFVKRNGEIYLQLLGDLLVAVKADNAEALHDAQTRASVSLKELVDKVARSVMEGKLPDPYGRLAAELAALQGQGGTLPSASIPTTDSRLSVRGQTVGKVTNVYEASVAAVSSALTRLQDDVICPTLLCLPDLLVLQPPDSTPSNTIGKRDRVPWVEAPFDGHAALGALTAAYLCPSTAGDFQVFLATRIGGQGENALGQAASEVRKAGAVWPRFFTASGEDRMISFGKDTAGKVHRRITPRTERTELSWKHIEDSGVLSWLRAGDHACYGLLIGDAEWDPGSYGRDKLRDLVEGSKITVINTVYSEDSPESTKTMWNWIAEMVRSRVVVSVSDEDAPKLLATVIPGTRAPSEGVDGAYWAAGKLAETLQSGHVLLHGKSANILFSCGGRTNTLRVPTCNIEPQSTNGIGDTFNGAFAFAALCLSAASDPKTLGTQPTGLILEHAVCFATAVVSRLLANGRFPTRDVVEKESRPLKPHGELGAMKAVVQASRIASTERVSSWEHRVVSHGSSRHAVAAGFPKLALVDLDYTLCDSRTWRETALRCAIAELVPQVNSSSMGGPPTERLLNLYHAVYGEHDTWGRILGVNPRYNWHAKAIFALLLLLDERFEGRGVEAGEVVGVAKSVAKSEEDPFKKTIKQIVDGKHPFSAAVKAAEKAFANTHAMPYADAVAGLCRLHDELGYRLFLVTDGDDGVQTWKFDKLGLREFFPGKAMFSESAIANEWQVEFAFHQAETQAREQGKQEEEKKLIEAETICQKWAAEVKSSFRVRTLARILKHETEGAGVFVCTIGDRVDTDVMPYHSVRAGVPKGRSGLVTFRLTRGPYRDRASKEEDADLVMSGWAGIGEVLSEGGFWRDRVPLTAESVPSMREAMPCVSMEEVAVVTGIADKWDCVAPVVRRIMDLHDIKER